MEKSLKYQYINIIVKFICRDGFAKVYPVGPGQPCESIGDEPWELLNAGDSVPIHFRDSSYHEKWVICRAGTENAPIAVKGLPNEDGDLPVIDGRDATTRAALKYWNKERGVIKIGGAIYIEKGEHIKIRGCILHDCGKGLFCGSQATDLVDSDIQGWYSDALYRNTYVYGNILVEGEGEGNSQVIHYGSDSGDEPRYRCL